MDFQSLSSSINLGILLQAQLILKETHTKPGLFFPLEHLIIHFRKEKKKECLDASYPAKGQVEKPG